MPNKRATRKPKKGPLPNKKKNVRVKKQMRNKGEVAPPSAG